MPPKHTESSRNSAHQEGRLLLAIQAIKNKEISSVRQAVEQFHVARTTLQRRLTGHIFRTETHANSHKLTQIEEETLKNKFTLLILFSLFIFLPHHYFLQFYISTDYPH
jgi:hypothetical protein